jgi:hypothetical protein
MSAAELDYRAAQTARASVDRLTPPHALHVPAIEVMPQTSAFVQYGAKVDPAAYIIEAQRILAGRFSVFHLIDCELGNPPQWNRDPLTGKVAPLDPAASLDYRDERLVGAPLFADAGGRAFRDRWMQSVYLQTRAITRKLSRFSSANNHIIGETAGVYIASITWNCWTQMRAWGLQCKEITFSALSLAVGVAGVRAFERCGAQNVGLKWPNDLLWQARKLGERMVWTAARVRKVLKVARSTRYGGRVEASENLFDWPILQKASVRDDPRST